MLPIVVAATRAWPSNVAGRAAPRLPPALGAARRSSCEPGSLRRRHNRRWAAGWSLLQCHGRGWSLEGGRGSGALQRRRLLRFLLRRQRFRAGLLRSTYLRSSGALERGRSRPLHDGCLPRQAQPRHGCLQGACLHSLRRYRCVRSFLLARVRCWLWLRRLWRWVRRRCC